MKTKKKPQGKSVTEKVDINNDKLNIRHIKEEDFSDKNTMYDEPPYPDYPFDQEGEISMERDEDII